MQAAPVIEDIAPGAVRQYCDASNNVLAWPIRPAVWVADGAASRVGVYATPVIDDVAAAAERGEAARHILSWPVRTGLRYGWRCQTADVVRMNARPIVKDEPARRMGRRGLRRRRGPDGGRGR